MTQLPLDFTHHHTAVELMAQRGRQRVLDGVVDRWGKHTPDGPRQKLTERQRRAYDLHVAARGCQCRDAGVDAVIDSAMPRGVSSETIFTPAAM